MDQSPDSGVTEPVRPQKSEGGEASSLLRDIYFEHNRYSPTLVKNQLRESVILTQAETHVNNSLEVSKRACFQ